jgi:2'-5' RNA ligase
MERTFLAVPVPPRVRATYTRFREDARDWKGWRWVSPQNLHVTLRFLGPAEAAQLRALRLALVQAVRTTERFTATLGGGGTFGSRRVPNVLWIGFDEGLEELVALLRAVSQAADSVGFAPEKRVGKPHLTVARNAKRQALEAWPGGIQFDGFRGQALPVEGVALYSSHLGPAGAVYTQVWTVPLAGA